MIAVESGLWSSSQQAFMKSKYMYYAIPFQHCTLNSVKLKYVDIIVYVLGVNLCAVLYLSHFSTHTCRATIAHSNHKYGVIYKYVHQVTDLRLLGSCGDAYVCIDLV